MCFYEIVFIFQTEALSGYSRVICRTLLNESNKESEFYRFNIELMNAVVIAADCSVKFVGNVIYFYFIFHFFFKVLFECKLFNMHKNIIFMYHAMLFSSSLSILFKLHKYENIKWKKNYHVYVDISRPPCFQRKKIFKIQNLQISWSFFRFHLHGHKTKSQKLIYSLILKINK